jgi:hypothetical protein
MIKKIIILIITVLSVSAITLTANTVALAEDTGLDNSALSAAISIADGMLEEQYTPESFQQMNSANASAKAMLDNAQTQQDIDLSAQALLEAINSLIPYLNLSVSANIENAGITVSYGGNTYTDTDYNLTYGTQITLNAPESVGNYYFAGWYETASRRIMNGYSEYTTTLSVNTSIQALYFKEDEIFLIFANESGQFVSINAKTASEWETLGSLDTLIPPVPIKYGASGGHWDLPDNALSLLISGEPLYIIPVYDNDYEGESSAQPNEGEPKLTLRFSYDRENSVGSFIMDSVMPYSINPVSIGILFSYGSANQFNPSEFYVNINNKMLVSQFEMTHDRVYITHIRKFYKTRNWAARGYATYYDANGVLRTVYSNQMNVIRTVAEHTYVTVEAVEPTCTESGYTEGTQCSDCGEYLVKPQEIAPLGHSFVETVIQPTCTSDGCIVNTCSRCGYEIREYPEYNEETGEYTHPELLKTEHSYEQTIIQPTCTANGYIIYTCADCGHEEREYPEYNEETGEYTHPELLMTEHSFIRIRTVTEPTFDSDGEYEAQCETCGRVETFTDTTVHGECGEDIAYTFERTTGELTLSGSGEMYAYSNSDLSPFYENTLITKITVEEGITSVAPFAFFRCSNVCELELPSSLLSI